MDPLNDSPTPTLNAEALASLSATRKWAMFLAVLGFIASGLLVLAGLFFAVLMRYFGQTEELGSFTQIIVALIYLIIGVAYFFPSYFLFQFSTRVKTALTYAGDVALADAFRYLRMHLTFLGVAAIVIILLYLLAVIVAVAVGVFSAAHGNAV